MTHFLDTLPLDLGNPAARQLRDFLASIYFKEGDIEHWASAADLNKARIQWGSNAQQLWEEVLSKARNQEKLRYLVEVIIAEADAAVATRVRELTQDQPVIDAPQEDELAWKASTTVSGEDERQTADEPSLVDVAFLERGVVLARSVVRLLVTMSDGKRYNGTGFLIARGLVLTNHHVLFDGAGQPATTVEVWFGYEREFEGAERAKVVAAGDPTSIQGESALDWAVVRVDDVSVPEFATILDLGDRSTVGVDERVNIIQHPGGGPKQIAMVHNVVRFVDDDVLQYLTDTEAGSSGSPVFNERWQIVGLHHQGKVVTQGGESEIRNQGLRIDRVVDRLKRAGLT